MFQPTGGAWGGAVAPEAYDAMMTDASCERKPSSSRKALRPLGSRPGNSAAAAAREGLGGGGAGGGCGTKRRRDPDPTTPRAPWSCAELATRSPSRTHLDRDSGSAECAKRPRRPSVGPPAWSGADASGVGGGWSAPPPDPTTLDLAPYETAAAGLVIRDKGFWRLRWAVGQMACPLRSQASAAGPASPGVAASQLVALLREGWGGVLMTASQACQLREVLAQQTMTTSPRAVDPDIHYVLCCRVVDWWNLPLSYTAADPGAAAAVEAYSQGRHLPPQPEGKALVAEMAEHSACVERQLGSQGRLGASGWGWQPVAPLRQLGLSEAAAALGHSGAEGDAQGEGHGTAAMDL